MLLTLHHRCALRNQFNKLTPTSKNFKLYYIKNHWIICCIVGLDRSISTNYVHSCSCLPRIHLFVSIFLGIHQIYIPVVSLICSHKVLHVMVTTWAWVVYLICISRTWGLRVYILDKPRVHMLQVLFKHFEWEDQKEHLVYISHVYLFAFCQGYILMYTGVHLDVSWEYFPFDSMNLLWSNFWSEMC